MDILAKEQEVDGLLDEIKLYGNAYDAVAYLKAEITVMQRQLDITPEYEDDLRLTKFNENDLKDM